MKNLAIVGSHPGSRDSGPFDDAQYTIWVFNEAPQQPWCKRWDATFQLHKPEVYTSPNNYITKEHWTWLQQDHGQRSIWMQALDDRVPNSKRFPMDEIIATIPAAAPVGENPFLTSTVAMAIALGLYLGYEQIELWGVDLSSGTEYAYQQVGFAYWCGVAKAQLGAGFIMHSGKQHFISRVYGYEGEVQIDRTYFGERASFLEKEHASLHLAFERATTKVQIAVMENHMQEFATVIVTAQEAAIAAGQAAGALQEARNYAGREDPISRQQFERRGAQANIDAQKAATEMDKTSGITEYVWNAWVKTGSMEAKQQLRTWYGKLLNHALTLGGNQGVASENARYMVEYDSRVTAAGGERTRKALGITN